MLKLVVHVFVALLLTWPVVIGVVFSTALAQDSRSLNFKLMYRAAQLAEQAYDRKHDIVKAYAPGTVWVNTPGKTNVQYILVFDDNRKRQIIAVRGTVNDSNWKLDKDRRGVKDQRAGVLLHSGFRKAADTIYKDVRPRLKPGYTTYLTGHSLGGAVAAILGIYLWDDKVKVGGIMTFGQPKFTNLQGATAYQKLPILRVVYQNDTVSLLPEKTSKSRQRFVHVGPVLNLLSGPHYIYGTAEQSIRFDQLPFRKFMFQISLPDHKMKWYLQSLRDKRQDAKRVSFKDRNKYITRHKYGSGVDTVLPKREYNFNHHK
jgi:hypothetical protein